MSSETKPTLRPSPGPKPPDSEIDVYGLTHTGKVRQENQDHFLMCQLKRQIEVHFTSLPDIGKLPLVAERLAYLAMVADGVGSTAGGEEASRHAVEAVTRYVSESIHIYYTSDPDDDQAFLNALADAANRCHVELLTRRPKNLPRSSMATTLTMWIGLWPKAYLVQVGDSRYYLLRGQELIQVSRDQTIAQELIDQGVFSRAQAEVSPWANVLSSAIGGPAAAPVVTRIDQERNQVHLVCSDGLTRHVSDERIGEVLRNMTSCRQAAEVLLEDALRAGGKDNITIVLGRSLPPGSVTS